LARIKDAKKKVNSLGDGEWGNFFTNADYQFYKAVMYFYDAKYDKAAENFRKATEIYEKHVEQ
jgi:hypothetical protein